MRPYECRRWYQLACCITALITLTVLASCKGTQDNAISLTVMSYNIGNFPLEYTTADKIAAQISKHGTPDVLFLQDVPWAVNIEDLSHYTGLPYFIEGQKLMRLHHLGLLSRFPLQDQDVLSFPGVKQRPAFICAKATLGNRDTLLCNLHLQSPSNEVRHTEQGSQYKMVRLYNLVRKELFGSTPRSRSIEQILNWIDSRKTDLVVIGGDFNSFQLSRPIRMMSNRFRDSFWPSLSYFRGSFKGLDFPVRPRLDYIFHSKSITSVNSEIISDTRGNHFPVRTTLGVPATQ